MTQRPKPTALARLTLPELEALWIMIFLEPPAVRATREELALVLAPALAARQGPGACAPSREHPLARPSSQCA